MSGLGVFWIVVAVVVIILVLLRIIPRYYDTEDLTFYVGAIVCGLAAGVTTLVVMLAFGDDLQDWMTGGSTYWGTNDWLHAAFLWVPTICIGVIVYWIKKAIDEAAEEAAA